MGNAIFHEDLDGHVYRHVSGAEEEPLYIMKLYGLAGADPAEVIRRWTGLILEREKATGGREVNAQVWIRGRGGYGRKSISVRQGYLDQGDVMNLVRSVLPPGDSDKSQVRLSFFRPKPRRKKGEEEPTAKQLLAEVSGSVKRIEERVEQQFELLLKRGLNYRQAATELGIPETEAFEMADRLMN